MVASHHLLPHKGNQLHQLDQDRNLEEFWVNAVSANTSREVFAGFAESALFGLETSLLSSVDLVSSGL